MRRPGDGTFFSGCVFALLSLYAVHVVEAVAARTYLYADGVFCLLDLIERGWFVWWQGSRAFSSAFTQIPPVAALLAGVVDLRLLSYLYGVGLYAPYIICIAVSLLTSGRQDCSRLILLYFLFACGMNSDLVIANDSHATAALFMSLVFLLLSSSSSRPVGMLAAVLLSLPLVRAYESMMLFGPILIGLCIWRMTSNHDRGRLYGLPWLAPAVWLLAGTAIATGAALSPRDAGNYQNFRENLLAVLHPGDRFNIHACLSVAALAFLATCFYPSRWVRLLRAAGVLLFAGAIVAASIAVYRDPARLGAPFHYGTRVLNLPVPVFLALALIALRMGWIRMEWAARQQATAVVALLGAFQMWTGQLIVNQWRGYMELFRNEVREARGVVEFGETAMQQGRLGRQLVGELNWGWTMPVMSIFLAPEGRVQTIIKNPQPVRWEPFDPEKARTLPALERYGIVYSRSVRQSGTRNLVANMYAGLLGRTIEPGGLDRLTERFEEGYTTAGIEGLRAEARKLGKMTLGSSEFQAQNRTARALVVRLYQGFLGRPPSNGEIAYWEGELVGGRQTPEAVIGAFTASEEFTVRLNARFGGG